MIFFLYRIQKMTSTDIIIHDKKDNVGVVVIEKVAPNQIVTAG